ncbi:nucleoside-triphosphatase [Rossellomorea marisflavi]
MDSTFFLLSGRPRIGKSTLIKQLIDEIGADRCGGFYTEEVTNVDDRIGFRCISLDGESVEMANVESLSETRVGRYGVNLEEFDLFARDVLQDALRTKDIIVIDEIGYMQMFSHSFKKIVQEIFSGNKIVLGTIPSNSPPEIMNINNLKHANIITINEINRDKMSGFLVREVLSALG